MKLAVLFSGGKDSTLAMKKAMEHDEVACLVAIVSKNKESYMFHTPNINLAKLQAEAIGLPLIEKETLGEKEVELSDLKDAISSAKKKYHVEGVVTGAIESVYQAERVQKICDELGLWCFNPLWKKDQEELLHELLDADFKVMISGIFAYPLKKELLGKVIDKKIVASLLALRDKYKISPSGEGGEIETTVLDAPFFKKKLEIVSGHVIGEDNSAVFVVESARLDVK
jgi:diphthine-ammonia ligase